MLKKWVYEVVPKRTKPGLIPFPDVPCGLPGLLGKATREEQPMKLEVVVHAIGTVEVEISVPPSVKAYLRRRDRITHQLNPPGEPE